MSTSTSTSEDSITAALAWATALSARAPYSAPPRLGAPFTTRVAMGDPQAPFARVLEVLDAHGLLAPDGALAPGVQLVAMGDYFDWGKPHEARSAAVDGLRLLAWLAAHPADQVVMLAGNHDLARVGELASLSDDAFDAARSEALAAYVHNSPLRDERLFREQYGLPSWELAARDFSAFRAEQRAWVAALVRAGRLRIAYADARSGALFTHAGVTTRELDVLSLTGPDRRDAGAIARALEARFERAVRAWEPPGPLEIPELHRPGDARAEGGGMLYHRLAARAPRTGRDTSSRRAHVSEVPLGVTQAIGHVRDKKSRALLGLDEGAARDGALRALTVSIGGDFRYESRLERAPLAPDEGRVLHLDGGMSHADPRAYELLDLDTLAPRAAPAR